jgi:hypothetical protein
MGRRRHPVLIDHARRQAIVLCDIADQLNEETASVLVPSLLVSDDAPGLDQDLKVKQVACLREGRPILWP